MAFRETKPRMVTGRVTTYVFQGGRRLAGQGRIRKRFSSVPIDMYVSTLLISTCPASPGLQVAPYHLENLEDKFDILVHICISYLPLYVVVLALK